VTSTQSTAQAASTSSTSTYPSETTSSSDVISTLTVTGATTISSSGNSPIVVETTHVTTIQVTPTSTPGSTVTGISPADITSIGSGLVTATTSTSSTSIPAPHVLSKSGTSWHIPVAASVSGAAFILVLLLLGIFLCKRRRRRLNRFSQRSPVDPNGDPSRTQENVIQVREDVLPIMSENPGAAISSHTPLLPQHHQRHSPVANFAIESDTSQLSQTEPLKLRQNMALVIPEMRRDSFTGSSTEPVRTSDDARSSQKSQIASERVIDNRQSQDWEDRGTIASSGILPPPTYTSLFRNARAEEVPPMPSPYRRPLPLPGVVQNREENHLSDRRPQVV
jgi:hypothetical protein